MEQLSTKQIGVLKRLAEDQHALHKDCKRSANLNLLLWMIGVVLVALCIRAFIAEPVQVMGDSMLPNLLDRERMLTEKFTYAFSEPQRGDVVVVDYPGYSEHCVKRVVALPGETVEILAGSIYINGQLLNESAYWNGVIIGDMAPLTVPERSIFVVGDNRNYSKDSRDPSVGCIPYEHVIGRSTAVIWPPSNARSLTGERRSA